MLTWWDVKVQGPGLVVGQFQFIVKHDNRVLATVETEEITVNGPEQRIRVMLPAIDETSPRDQLQIEISIRGKTLNSKLGEQVLRVPFATKKTFMGLVAEPKLSRKRTGQRQSILEHLKFESLVQEETQEPSADDNTDMVKTILTSMSTNDLPSDPLAYCGYDLVVLMDEEFRTMRAAQLEAILAWIKAGGNLFVEPKGIMEPFHLDFLRNVAAEDPQQIVFPTDAAGRVLPDSVPSAEIAHVVGCGLGHVAIRTDDSDRELPKDPSAWKKVTGPLWNERHHVQRLPVLVRQAVGPNGQVVVKEDPNPDPFGLKTVLGTRLRVPIAELIERLMPEGVRMVPLSVLATILVAFVILIGPGEYFVLGWLRLRKLTWLTFPAATIGVTALTIWVSNSYMSAAETRRAVTICDLNHAGETIRTNRFELLYIASSRRVSTDLDKQLFTPLRSSANLDQVGTRRLRPSEAPVTGYQMGTDGQVMAIPPTFEGRIPTLYAASQEVQKWTPQLNRTFSIPGPSQSPPVDWDEFNLDAEQAQAFRRHEIPPHILAQAKQQFGTDVMVACISQIDGWAYNREADWGKPTNDPFAQQRLQQPMLQPPTEEQVVEQLLQKESPLFRWLYRASVAPTAPGLFSIVKQLTPKGGILCDDLPIFDTTNPSSWLLLIVVPQKDEYRVYRKLMQITN